MDLISSILHTNHERVRKVLTNLDSRKRTCRRIHLIRQLRQNREWREGKIFIQPLQHYLQQFKKDPSLGCLLAFSSGKYLRVLHLRMKGVKSKRQGSRGGTNKFTIHVQTGDTDYKHLGFFLSFLVGHLELFDIVSSAGGKKPRRQIIIAYAVHLHLKQARKWRLEKAGEWWFGRKSSLC